MLLQRYIRRFHTSRSSRYTVLSEISTLRVVFSSKILLSVSAIPDYATSKSETYGCESDGIKKSSTRENEISKSSHRKASSSRIKKIKTMTALESQWQKPLQTIFDYVPTKYKANSTEWRIRRFIWEFKDGKRTFEAAKIVANNIIKSFGDAVKGMLFVCVPASSQAKNTARYRNFCDFVCRLTGMNNGFDAVEVEGERLAIHERGTKKSLQSVEVVKVNPDKVKGQKVIVFDDIITRGYSYARFACEVERNGAQVMGGVFLGRTIQR
jgi:phosphoribosylpyrophosphate synthetase